MISAVVVTYDSADCIGSCVGALRTALPAAELVVVDNGSTDATVELARAAAPDARVIETGRNLGFGRACNAGAEAATHDHVLFLNPDVTVASVDEAALRRLLERRPFGLAAPVLDDEAERRRGESPWALDYVENTLRAFLPREWQPRLRSRSDGAAWVSAAILLAARDEFLQLGGFDPRFFLYYEDRDLSRRYRDARLPIVTTSAIRAAHAGSRSSANDGVRAAPMAWALLGWIQYVSARDGDAAARRTARAALATLRTMRSALHVLEAARWSRAHRKAGQLDEVLRLVAERAADGDGGYCPDALRAVRAAGGAA